VGTNDVGATVRVITTLGVLPTVGSMEVGLTVGSTVSSVTTMGVLPDVGETVGLTDVGSVVVGSSVGSYVSSGVTGERVVGSSVVGL